MVGIVIVKIIGFCDVNFSFLWQRKELLYHCGIERRDINVE